MNMAFPRAGQFGLAALLCLAGATAVAQQVSHGTCQYIDVPMRDVIPDREGHAVGAAHYSCRYTDGPYAGATTTGVNVLEWNGTRGHTVASHAITRKAGAMTVALIQDSNSEVLMKDGKPNGNQTVGSGVISMGSGELAPLNGHSFHFMSKGTSPYTFDLEVNFD